MEDTKINAVFERLERVRPSIYPIENAYLKDSPDYIRNTYLRILCTVLLCADNIGGEALNMLCRIAAGSGSEQTIEEYFRQALDITAEEYEAFFTECGEKPIGCRLVFEAMVIMGFERTERQVRLAAHLCELLKMQPNAVRYIAARARAAIELSDDAAASMVINRIEDFSEEVFNGYKKATEGKWLFKDKNNTVICMDYIDTINRNELVNAINAADTPCVTLRNLNVSLEPGSKDLVFKNKDEVIIDDCTFFGYTGKWNEGSKEKHPSVYLENCRKVVVINSVFYNFSCRVLTLKSIKNMRVEKSVFRGCWMNYSNQKDWWQLGEVIYSDKPENIGVIVVDSCTFKNCGGYNSEYYVDHGFHASAIVSNCKCDVKKSKFSNCKHYYKPSRWSNKQYDINDSRSTLFTKGSQAINCTFKDSFKFN